MKTAIVYDRVNKWGGAERVLLALHEMFPDAPLFTAVYDEKKAVWAKVFPEIRTTFLQKIPFAKGNHELLGTFTPIAFETFDFTGFDLVISVTSEAAKGIVTKPDTKHICYMLTPTRYLWSAHDYYFRNPVLKLFSRPAVGYLRQWDKIAASRPDKMIAISSAVQKRIKKYYKRDSEVIFPPAGILFTALRSAVKSGVEENFYLVVSRLVAYKRTDLVIEAFNSLGKRLVIVGSGSQLRFLKLKAKKNITFAGDLTDKELAGYYQKAKALIMPQEEDFGLTAVEAQSLGTPVIAFKGGGALDSVVDGKTGVFFNKQTTSSLKKAVKRFEKTRFSQQELKKNADKFSKDRFKKEFLKVINA